MIAGPNRVPAPDGTRLDDAPLLVLPEGASLKGMKLSYLAAGGMSVAYKGVRPDGKTMFVKEVPKSQSQAVISLTQEKALLERLQHPSIPRLQDFCEWRDHLYLVQDFIEGTNLEQQISPFPDIFLPEAQVRNWGLQLCDILHYLHSQIPPIIYRDLKPKNVLLHPSGQLYLVDFGIARAYKQGKDQDTRLLGSVLTASPEHYGGQTDIRSDIYTLGATLHYLLTNGQGERVSPFDFPPISALRPEVSRELQGIIEKCLDRAPEQRFASIEALAQALRGGEVPPGRPAQSPAVADTPAVQPSEARARRGLPGWAQIGLGLVLGWLLSGLVRWAGTNPSNPPPSPIAVNLTPALTSPSPEASPGPIEAAPERTATPRPLPTRPQPKPTVPVAVPIPPRPRPSPKASPPRPRPSPTQPRFEPQEPAYPQRVTPSDPSGRDSGQQLLDELGLPWGHFQDLRSSTGQNARPVSRAEGPGGIFSIDAPEGFRYLGGPQDFLLLRWQRRNFEAIRLRTIVGQSGALAELVRARQQQLAEQLQQTVNLEFQGRTVPALVLQVPGRRFQVVELIWTQSQPACTLSISGGAAAVRFPAYLAEFQAHLKRIQF